MTSPLDLQAVPATPVYTVLMSTSGAPVLNGRPVPVAEGDGQRQAVLAELRICAAQRGRPVRVTVREADGRQYALVVEVNGQVHTLETPHPAPAVPPRPDRPPFVAPHRTVVDDLLRAVREADRAEDLPTARQRARELQRALHDAVGADHPQTLDSLVLRAWLALRADDWHEAVPAVLAAGRQLHRARPGQVETRRIVRNAAGAWCRLSVVDPDAARGYAADVLDLVRTAGNLPPDRLALFATATGARS